MVSTEKEKINVAKNKVKNTPKGIVFLLILLLTLIFLVVFCFVNDTTSEKNERLSELKEKCYLQIALSEDEKEELCALLVEIENLPQENCDEIEKILHQAHLKSFLNEQMNCANDLKQFIESKGFDVKIEITKNFKGQVIFVKKNNKDIFYIRFMHRSSGGTQYKNFSDYFIIFYTVDSNYIDKKGIKNNSRQERHIPMTSCEEIKSILNLFLIKYNLL